MTLVRNCATPEGHELGKLLAKWCDASEPKARLRMPWLQPRCQSCAFRDGQHVQNGSVTTTMDALKCVMEGREFHCHQPDRTGQICSGWAMFMLSKDTPDFRDMPWPFSDDAEGLKALADGAPA